LAQSILHHLDELRRPIGGGIGNPAEPNPLAIQLATGHSSLETTTGYLQAES
jgi:hypothetical protein